MLSHKYSLHFSNNFDGIHICVFSTNVIVFIVINMSKFDPISADIKLGQSLIGLNIYFIQKICYGRRARNAHANNKYVKNDSRIDILFLLIHVKCK